MQFYVLDDEPVMSDWVYKTEGAEIEPIHRGEAPTCPKCGKYAGMLQWLPPYRAEVKAFGKQLGDVAFATGNDLLVSDKFRSAWERAGLRGIVAFGPLERIRVRPARLGRGATPVYFHIAARRWGTRVDPDRSLIEYDERYRCEKCGSPNVETVRGFSIDESSWTGEDIFRPWGLSSDIVVSDRVRQLLDDYGLTNVNLVRTEDYLYDPHNEWTPCVWQLPE